MTTPEDPRRTMALTPPEHDAPLVLTPPEPVPAVRAEQASGLVPLDESVRLEMSRRADEYVGSLSGLDPRSPEFAGRINEIAALGAGEIRTAAQQSNRMLDRTVRSLGQGGGDAQARVGSSSSNSGARSRTWTPGTPPPRASRDCCRSCPAATGCGTTSPSTPPRRPL